MVTRRELILSASAFAALGVGPSFAAPGQPTTAITFDVPPDACDCHTHIHDPSQFPYSPQRVYTPEPALPDQMAALHKALHIDRVVIVTPSPYGIDNSATRFGIKARGSNARGIAVISDTTSDAELESLHRDGFRGIRVNLASEGNTDVAVAKSRLQAAIDRLKHRPDWHIEMFADLAVIRAIKPIAIESPVPLLFDHFAGAKAAPGTGQPGFSDVVDLLHSGRVYVTLSGAYRSSTLEPDYPDVVPLAKALIAANPERIVWGSDWPHPHSSLWAPQQKRATLPPGHKQDPLEPEPYYQLDDAVLLNQLAVWAPDAATRKRILVDNPKLLYGF
jgi:predicted TIM-barrel fold metal-dependent hydrolase